MVLYLFIHSFQSKGNPWRTNIFNPVYKSCSECKPDLGSCLKLLIIAIPVILEKTFKIKSLIQADFIAVNPAYSKVHFSNHSYIIFNRLLLILNQIRLLHISFLNTYSTWHLTTHFLCCFNLNISWVLLINVKSVP